MEALFVVALVLFAIIVFCSFLAAQSDRDKENARLVGCEQRYKSIFTLYQQMKCDDDCQKLFCQCKAIIEQDPESLIIVHSLSNGLAFRYRKTYTKPHAWSAEMISEHKQDVFISFSDFLQHTLSKEGIEALLYWLVSEVPNLVYICQADNMGHRQQTRDLHIAVINECKVDSDYDAYTLNAVFPRLALSSHSLRTSS